MSDNHSARQDGDAEPEALDDDVDESIVADRAPRAPSIQRLGRYRLVREIASGGMASVNLAVTEGLDKLVALKIIHPHLAQEESFVRMFLDEARLASAITHRNVCNVFDFGETDGRFYIAMDYLSGQSLRDVLRRLRKTDLQMEPRRIAVYVAYMIAEACEGLHAAHELHSSEGKPLNVVHRDVSPHNLFVTYDGNVSVVDFGIARASDRIQNTATGVLKGKFSYMAPEQMRQLEIDRRADIWALGVVLWESLTLNRLFVRSSQADTVMSVMMDRVRPPSEIKPDLPKELDAIVLKAISRSPAQRYTTAREMGRELMKFCRESGVMVSPIEIEHLMERLFEKEILESKQLMRKAKQSGNESGVWMEVTPSGFGRIPRSSGSVEKGQWTSGGIDVVGEGSQSTSKRVVPGSLSAPAAEARATAAPDVATAPATRSKKPVIFAAALAACALVGGTYVLTRQAQPQSEAISASGTTVQNDRVGAVAPGPGAPVVEPAPSTKQQPPAADTAPTVEPLAINTPTPPPRATAPVQRAEPVRRDVRGRPVQRAAPSSQASRDQREDRDADSPGSGRTGSDEVAVRGPEATPAAAPSAPEREEAPAPAAVIPAPVAPAAVVQKPAAAPAAPAAPQRLDAQASIADLDVEGSLGTGVVGRMLGRVTPALKGCYVDAAKRANRNDFTGMPVSLVIDEGGAVRQINVGRHGLSDLSSCATNALKRLRSERVPDVGTVQVKFRVAFTP